MTKPELVRCQCVRVPAGRPGVLVVRRGITRPCPDCKGTRHPGWCLPTPPDGVIVVDLTRPTPEESPQR